MTVVRGGCVIGQCQTRRAGLPAVEQDMSAWWLAVCLDTDAIKNDTAFLGRCARSRSLPKAIWQKRDQLGKLVGPS